jgi:hypothetical protein
MIVAVVIAVLVLGFLIRRRAARKRLLAGLEATRPTFTVAPPSRSLISMKDHRL